MIEKLKIQLQFNRLKAEIGHSLENAPILAEELKTKLSSFESVIAPEKGIYPWEEKYWFAKTAMVMEYVQNLSFDKNTSTEDKLLSCGYDNNEIERVKWIMSRKLERRVSDKSI